MAKGKSTAVSVISEGEQLDVEALCFAHPREASCKTHPKELGLAGGCALMLSDAAANLSFFIAGLEKAMNRVSQGTVEGS